MQASGIPTKLPIPWANSAGSGYIRTVPQASQIGIQNGAASLTDGFPPLNFLPTASGGVPPFGQDFNGILKLVTQWLQWTQAGAPIAWDSSFSSSIGGYPSGAVVLSATTPQLWWLSTSDNNVTNPDAGGAGWVPLMLGMASRFATLSTNATLTIANAGIYYNVASGVTATLPAPSASRGLPFGFFQASGNGTVTTPSGLIYGGALSAGTVTLSADAWLCVQSDGGNYRVISASPDLVAVRGMQVFTASGTWTVPPGVTRVRARVWGGGGGGGGCVAGAAGSGGSGGGYSEGTFVVTPGASIAVTVGAAGSGGANGGGNGGNGGSSWFGGLCSGTGGFAGYGASVAGAGGMAVNSAGTGTGGAFNVSGGGTGPGLVAGGNYFGSPGGSAYGASSTLMSVGGGGGGGIFPGGGGGGDGGSGPVGGGIGGGGCVIVEY